MEAACNRILEIDGDGGAHLHKIGGAGSYEKFKEVRPTAGPDPARSAPICGWAACLCLVERCERCTCQRMCTFCTLCKTRRASPYSLAPLPQNSTPQAREARRLAQANAAADARTVLRRESEWMARQPKARSTKSR